MQRGPSGVAQGGQRHSWDTGRGDRPCTGPESWGWGEHGRQQAKVGMETKTQKSETNREGTSGQSCHLHSGHWEMVELLSLVFF